MANKVLLFLILFLFVFCGNAKSITYSGVSLNGVTTNSVYEVHGSIIMFTGDSLTKGITIGSSGQTEIFGYRDNLQSLLRTTTANNVYIVEGGLTNPQNTASAYSEKHYGNAGWTTANLNTTGGTPIEAQLDAVFVISAAAHSKVILLIGTNDVNASTAETITADIATAMTNITSIINKINTHDSTINVYIGKLPPIGLDATKNGWIVDFNTSLNSTITTLQATKTNLFLVDLYTPIYSHTGWETDYQEASDPDPQLHFNDAGYAVMGNTWSQAIILNFANEQ